MASLIKKLIDSKDNVGLREALSRQPALANEGLPFDERNLAEAHPLHRLCDGVHAGRYTGEEALEMAKIFFASGARVDGNSPAERKDTPLIAAASLHADLLAIFYLENGAAISHPGSHGGTALHWAAWCGRDKVVHRLIGAGAEINRRCLDFKATPLFWAVHGWKKGEKHNQQACIELLLQAGADKSVADAQGRTAFDLLTEEDCEIRELLQ